MTMTRKVPQNETALLDFVCNVAVLLQGAFLVGGRVYNPGHGLDVELELADPVQVMRQLTNPVITADLPLNRRTTMVNLNRTIRSVVLLLLGSFAVSAYDAGGVNH